MNDADFKMVTEKLSDRVICESCRKTFAGMNETCVAPIGEWCGGFDAIEEALG